MSHLESRWLAPALLCAGLSCNLYAVDGIVLIDQNRALAGNVTLGDAPGFPVTISLTGSYRLSGNLTVPNANTTGIMITADNVTIDLNGFSIIGPVVCTFSPFSCSPARTSGSTAHGVDGEFLNNISVVNGTVRGMGFSGIVLGGIGTSGGSVEKVHAMSNANTGIQCWGCTVRGNTANGNGGIGIAIINGTASGNTAQSTE